MMSRKQSKHRCSCFPQESSGFLYGLRREAPSTQRVLLERLLNVLSRAAAQHSRNPQQLWAKGKMPMWWPSVTNLLWKNPRELPKDTKEVLRKKIDILERELRQRGLMNPELEEELVFHRDSKKVDAELKSDLEAVMAKCSGLHFLVGKVQAKIGPSSVVSDKTASYLRNTKRCVESTLDIIKDMFQLVEDQEARRDSLWRSMGVSKEGLAALQIDLQLDDSYLTSGEVTFNEWLKMDDVHVSASPTALAGASLFSSHLCSSPIVSPLPVIGETPRPQTPRTETGDHVPLSPGDSLSVTNPMYFQRSLSAQDKPLQAMDLSQAKSVSLFNVSKRTRPSMGPDKHEFAPVRPKSRKMEQHETLGTAMKFVAVDHGVETTGIALSSTAQPSASRRPDIPAASEGSEGVQTAQREGRHQRRATTTEYRDIRLARTASPRSHTSWTEHALATSRASALRESGAMSPLSLVSTGSSSLYLPGLTSDVTVDAEELEDVDEILEVRNNPTMAMYETDIREMDQLRFLTEGLSCEDLSPSVTESFMDDLPVPSRGATLRGSGREHRSPHVAVSLSRSEGGNGRSTERGEAVGPMGVSSSYGGVYTDKVGTTGSVPDRTISSFRAGVSSPVVFAYSPRDSTDSERSRTSSSPQTGFKRRQSADSLSKAIGGLSGVF